MQPGTNTLNEAHFLRYFLRYFGNLSLQLYPVHFTSPASLLNFSWNLFWIALFLWHRYHYLSQSEANHGRQQAVISSLANKQLFALVLRILMRDIFPLSYVANTLYFLCSSWNSSKLLDYLTAFSVTQSKRRAQLAITTLILAHITFNTIASIPFYRSQMKYLPWPRLLFECILFYTLNANVNVTWFLVIYYKCATLWTVQSLVRQQPLHVHAIEAEMKRLTALNESLNIRFAFPLLLSLLSNTTQSLIIVAGFWIVDFRQINLFILQFHCNMILLAILSQRIDAQLRLLAGRLIANSLRNAVYIRTEGAALEQLHWYGVMAFYGKCLHLRLFNLVAINWICLVKLALFVLSYAVLLTQTTSVI